MRRSGLDSEEGEDKRFRDLVASATLPVRADSLPGDAIGSEMSRGCCASNGARSNATASNKAAAAEYFVAAIDHNKPPRSSPLRSVSAYCLNTCRGLAGIAAAAMPSECPSKEEADELEG